MKRLVLVLVVFTILFGISIQPSNAATVPTHDVQSIAQPNFYGCPPSYRTNYWWGFTVYLNHCDVTKLLYYWDLGSFYSWIPDPYSLVADTLWFNRIKNADHGNGVVLYFAWGIPYAPTRVVTA